MHIKTLITPPKTVAVVGLSDKPERPSNQVARYLIDQGFMIIPVNPMIKEVFGLKSYPSISTLPQDITIDIVDIFRRSEEVLPIVQEVIDNNLKPLIWMQEGVVSTEAEKLAKDHALVVIMDRCLMKTHRAL